MICEPDVTVSNVKSKASGAVIKNASGKTVTSGNIGTGYKITYKGKTFTVVKLGDTNSDGKITAGDYVNIKNDIMGKKNLSSVLEKGGDVDRNGKITAGDYVQVKNHIMGKQKISL